MNVDNKSQREMARKKRMSEKEWGERERGGGEL